jgi:hypothetical protein
MLKLVVKLGDSSKELFYDARLHIKSSFNNQRTHQIAQGHTNRKGP